MNMTADFDSNKVKWPRTFGEIKSIIKYQTTDGVLDTNKTKYPWGFDVVLKINMSRTCFGVWDMTNDHVCYYIMNIYSDSSHMALKYLKDTEVNIDNILVMTGDFNIRNSLWDTSFPHHSSISDNLIIIADSFNLALSTPTNPYSTRYSDTVGEANLVINLMFLWYGSSELNQHSIYPDSHLFPDHTPLTITIPIVDEIISTSKLSIPQNS